MILLVEDNESIAKGIKYSFDSNGFNLVVSNSINDSFHYLNNNLELIILDVSLPDGNGFDFYENEIKKLDVPVIFLTAMDSVDDIVRGLDMGASDYLTKPFSIKELIARVNKILRVKSKKDIISVLDISFDFSRMEVKKNNQVILLSSLELNILSVLFLNINKVVTREALLLKIWEWTGNDVDDHTLTVYIKRIKDKLDSNIITTIKKVGYRIDAK